MTHKRLNKLVVLCAFFIFLFFFCLQNNNNNNSKLMKFQPLRESHNDFSRQGAYLTFIKFGKLRFISRYIYKFRFKPIDWSLRIYLQQKLSYYLKSCVYWPIDKKKSTYNRFKMCVCVCCVSELSDNWLINNHNLAFGKLIWTYKITKHTAHRT